jgi:hypothetical protein
MVELAKHATDAFFVVAFLFPPILVVTYLATKVRARREELLRVLFADKLHPERWKAAGRQATDHPAWVFAGADGLDPKKPALAVELKFSSIQGLRHYLLPMFLTLVLSAAGLWLCRVWVHDRWFPPDPRSNGFPSTMREAVIMALAGAYVWGIWELLNRRQSGDLTPSELYDVAFRWAVSIPIGYAFSLLAGKEFQPAMAFAASVFPLKDIRRFIQERAMKKFMESPVSTLVRPEQRHLSTAVDGIGDAALTRLEELGIVTALDMAYADPMRVMIKTGYPFMNVVDWMDQAAFSIYVGDKRKAFQDAGIRCSIDVCEFVNMYLTKNGPNHAGIIALQRLRSFVYPVKEDGKVVAPGQHDGDLLVDLLRRIVADPQVKILYELWYSKGAPDELGGELKAA